MRVQAKSRLRGENSPLTPTSKSSGKELDSPTELNVDENSFESSPFEDSDKKISTSNQNGMITEAECDRYGSTRLKLYSAEHFAEGHELIIPPLERSGSMNRDDESATSFPGSESLKQEDNKSDTLTGANNQDDLTQYSSGTQFSLQTASQPKRKSMYLPRGSRTSIHEEKQQEQTTSPDSNPKTCKRSDSINSDEETPQLPPDREALGSQESMSQAVESSKAKLKRRASENTSTVHSQIRQLRQLRTPFDIIESELEESSVSVSHREKPVLVEGHVETDQLGGSTATIPDNTSSDQTAL